MNPPSPKQNNKKWRYIPFATYAGATNMAIDEALLDAVISGNSPNVLRFYKWKPSTATIGRNQSLSVEIDQHAAEELGVAVVRRITGGGAVYHDFYGEITYSVICRLADLPKFDSLRRTYDEAIPARYQVILEALAQGLEAIGIPIDVGKIHCPVLLTGGKKLSGNAQTIRKNVLLQHGTILLSVDPDLMYKILRAPEGVSQKRMVRSVRSKVAGILDPVSDEDRRTIFSDDKIVNSLRNGFIRVMGMELEEKNLDPEELSEVDRLIGERYQSKSWHNRIA